MHFHVSLDSSWWSMFQNISIRHQKPLNWKIFPLICSRASTWVDRPYWDVPVTSFILNLPHWITWRPWDIFIFYYVSHVFILPIAEPSAEASFVSFNFDWQEWRSNPARKKKTIPPAKCIMKREAVSWLQGSMWKAACWKNSYLHQTPLAHIQSDIQEIIWANTAYSRRVCVCVRKIWFTYICVCAELSLRHVQLARTINVTLCRCSNEYNGAVCSEWKMLLLGGISENHTHTSRSKLTFLTAMLLLLHCRRL